MFDQSIFAGIRKLIANWSIMSKLEFKVVYCTGQDDDFPVNELNQHTKDTKGYKTKA